MKSLDWFKEIQSRFEGTFHFNESLSKYSYYKMGGEAYLLTQPKSIDDLFLISEGIKKTGLPYFVMGNGSNLLISDEGYKGVVIRMMKYDHRIVEIDPCTVRTGCSVAIATLLGKACLEGWSGFSFLSGVPGSIGGVIRMNAGTRLGEVKDAVTRVKVFNLGDASEEEFHEQELQFAYRKNLFLKTGSIALSANWKIKKIEPELVKKEIQDALERRKQAQPVEFASCGSVFKNPKKDAILAWQVIDQLGLRGYQIGGAKFSEKHCNFIVHTGNAKSSDVHQLIELAKRRAFEELNVQLEEEVIRVGLF